MRAIRSTGVMLLWLVVAPVALVVVVAMFALWVLVILAWCVIAAVARPLATRPRGVCADPHPTPDANPVHFPGVGETNEAWDVRGDGDPPAARGD